MSRLILCYLCLSVFAILACIVYLTFDIIQLEINPETQLDIWSTRQILIHPNVDLFDNGIKVNYTTKFFKFDNTTAPQQGLCNHTVPEIIPQVNSNIPSNSCVKLRFATSLDNFPLTALASAPGSGNTWVRHLIQQLTGVYTGAVYNDIQLRSAGFLGEYSRDNSVIAIKTHEHWNSSLSVKAPNGHPKYPGPQYNKAILLVREPYGAILAEFNRHITRGHTSSVSNSAFNSSRWRKSALILAKRWVQTFEVWAQFRNLKNQHGCLLIVSYQHLNTQLTEELVQIGGFLGVKEEYLHGEHMQCIVNNSKGNFKRSKHNVVSDIYDREMNQTIDMYRASVNEILDYMQAGFNV